MSEFKEIDISGNEFEAELPRDFILWLERNFQILRSLLENGDGVSGTFTTADSKTVTVTNGIITNIV